MEKILCLSWYFFWFYLPIIFAFSAKFLGKILIAIQFSSDVKRRIAFGVAILSPEEKPFRKWSMFYIAYCSFIVYAGQSQLRSTEPNSN